MSANIVVLLMNNKIFGEFLFVRINIYEIHAGT